MKLVCRGRALSLESAVIMGVLNVTPDSFSDGGRWLDPEAAVAHGLEMVEHGAAIVDVGGESTRPDAVPVSEDEERRRAIPVVAALASSTDAVVSIDTRKPRVAEAALEAGAAMVNDTLGEEGTGAMDALAAEAGAAFVVMHSRGTPATMRSLARYEDVVSEVAAFLSARAAELEIAGVPRDGIVLDPGFGFAKTPAQNMDLLRELDRIAALGYPVLVGTSRKSFIGEVLGLAVDQRVEATAATMTWSVTRGARILRVHDVEPVVRAVRMTEALLARR
ncbi:MAG: dihydropteroate synthase [Actinomycetota bacterium]